MGSASAEANQLRQCGILGATGTVGQQFVLLLATHPSFKLRTVGASERSAGKPYKDVVKWKQAKPIPLETGKLVVESCDASNFKSCDFIFSGLDSDVAGPIGSQLLCGTPSESR